MMNQEAGNVGGTFCKSQLISFRCDEEIKVFINASKIL